MNFENFASISSRSNRLTGFVETLVRKFKPMQIYSFSTNVQLSFEEGCFTPLSKTQKFHYFLLMVMETPTRNEHEAQDFCRAKFGYGKITILSHSLETVQKCIRKNNRFFATILNDGKLLYNHTGFSRSGEKVPFSPAQNLEKAQKHYAHRIQLAKGFLDGAGDSYGKGHFSVSVFLVHQVIEQCTIGMIRVHLAYRSDIHNLRRQLDLCQSFSSEPLALFRNTNEDLRLLEILMKSYSQARHKDNFKVEENDADKLVSKGCAFFELTKTLCEDKILTFKKENELLKEREVSFE